MKKRLEFKTPIKVDAYGERYVRIPKKHLVLFEVGELSVTLEGDAVKQKAKPKLPLKLFLSGSVLSSISCLLRAREPTLDDLKRMVRDEPAWRLKLYGVGGGCGRGAIEKIENLCIENGINVGRSINTGSKVFWGLSEKAYAQLQKATGLKTVTLKAFRALFAEGERQFLDSVTNHNVRAEIRECHMKEIVCNKFSYQTHCFRERDKQK